MSQSKKPRIDFSEMAEHDVVALVTNTAVVAKNSGHPVTVRHARVEGQRGILVFMPGYELADGLIMRVQPSASA